MAASRQVPLVVLLLGGLLGGLGGAAALGAPDPEQEPVVRAAAQAPRTAVTPRATPRATPSQIPRPVVTTPPPGSLGAYALAADRVCRAAFAASKPVDLDRQGLAQVLADRVVSSALEVRTASALLALARPRDPKASRVPAVLTAHRSAYAAVNVAARDDGRALPVRSEAVARAEPRTAQTSLASGAVFLALGSEQCGAWLNPASLQDTGAD